MGLKLDIYKAFEKNLKYIDNDGKEVNPLNDSKKGQEKIDVLAEDLAYAILDFLTDKKRCVLKVDKLLASAGPVSVSPVPLVSSPAAVGAPVFTTVPPIPVITVAVDKDGQEGSNPIAGGLLHSNSSEVRLRRDNVKGESDKY